MTLFTTSYLGSISCRLEEVNLRNPRGIAKVLGTAVSLIGVTTMTLYKGPGIKNLWHPLVHIQGKSANHENWLKGSILCVASCITWSIWYIMQVKWKIMTSFHFPHQRCRSTLMIAYEKFVGIYVETISSTTVTNYLDELCWGSTISCLHGHCGA